MRYFILMTLTIVGAWGSSSYGQSTLDYPVGQRQPHDVDSGVRDNQAEAFETVFENLVRIEDAAWLRIYFGEVTLAEGSYIRITSLWDGEVQKLDARELALWSNSSAYFNGDALQVELVAGPVTKGNRVIIEQVAHHARRRHVAGGPGECGICDSDDRVPSGELWSARLLPAGCTASVWNTGSCMVSAGHCVGGSMVMQFNVPDSNPNCTLNNPPVADQFPVASVQFTNGGVGNDWSVMTTGTNNLGQTIYERYGELRPISDVVGSVGEVVSVWGYGVDTTCTRSQTQQTSSGLIDAAVSTVYTFTVDVRGGNSGSGLILNDEIIGVVTHCPCPNIATSVDHAAFAAARDALCPEDATTTLPFIDEFPSTAINFGLWIGLEGASIDDQGAGEPSPPFSLNIDGSDEIRSANMDTTGGTDLALNYSWQQTGDGGNTPEADNPLMVEYFNDQGDWVEINSHPGGGPDAEPYEQVSLVLPVGALHGSFRFRFRGTGNGGGQPAGFDDWFIDDVCVGTVGECQSGQACGGPEDCNDGIPCTIDDCLSNFCVNTPVNAVCDDGIACTADFCLPGIGCQSTPHDAACDDLNPCTDDNCDPVGGCVNAPNDANSCDDGDVCNGAELCAGGTCQAGTPLDCNDGIPCTTDDCLSNFCVNTPVNAVCDDGIACTADFCLPGIGCESTPDDAACDDGNGCTLDSCDAGSGCANAPDVGQPCDDGMECTINDSCDAEGQCIGEDNGCVALEAGLANLPICQDTDQDFIDVPLDICNVYVRLTSINDRLLSVGNSKITTTDPSGFFHHPFNSSVIAPPCAAIPSFPDLVCDSFVTIGLECGPDPAGTDSTTPDGDFDAGGFASEGHVVGGWFNAAPPNGQGDPGPDLRVLIAQFSLAQGQTVSGTLDAFALIDTNISAFPGLEFVCTGETLPCNEACPTDVDGDGQTGAFDLANLLGAWGPVSPDSACLDADSDGSISAFDLAVLLGAWGPCP